ncbi:MAG: glycosyltransferase family 2 protein [Chloroflexota bacterium]
MTNPEITVIMPAHNAENTIAAAIQSVLCQSYPDFELWVLESNSTDRTAEVARRFTDPRVKVFELGSLNFQDALIYGLENAKTEWLARMDADDLSFPERFQEQMDVIRQCPDLVLVGTRCVYLTPFGHIVETRPNAISREIGPLNLRLLGDDARFFVDGSVIFRRSVAQKVGGYDLEFQMGDVPLWFRMLSYGKGWEIAKPLYLYRLHPKSISRSKIAPSDELYRFLVKYTPDLLHLHYPEDAIQNPKSESWHVQHYWLRIAAYEALTGDRKSILDAVNFLDRDGPLKKEAMLIRWFSYMGRWGSSYYGWYKRHKYRHRPDLEKYLTGLMGQLAIERQFYSS